MDETDCLDELEPLEDGPAALEMAEKRSGRRDVCFEMFAERAAWMGTEYAEGEMGEVMVVRRVGEDASSTSPSSALTFDRLGLQSPLNYNIA